MKRIFLFLGIFLTSFQLLGANTVYQVPKGTNAAQLTHLEILKKLDEAFVELSKKVSKSVVFIGISKSLPVNDGFDEFFGFPLGPQGQMGRPEQKVEGVGSGFIIDIVNGYILTNNHVVGDADEIKVTTFDGKKYQAKVVGTDPKTDIAVIQVKNLPQDLGQIYLADSEKTEIGQWVIAVGAPHGLAQTVTRGSVSAKGRGSMEITDQGDFLQTDAAINPGNSGGPLINIDGDALGMNTVIISKSGGSQGIGLAIPSSLLRQVSEQLIRFGKVQRGMIGIYIQNLNEELAFNFGLPEDTKGVLIVNVQPGGPADKAGIKHGDIITKVDNKEIKDGPQLSYIISLATENKALEVELLRKGKTVKVSVNPSKHSAPVVAKTADAQVKGSSWGFTLVQKGEVVMIGEVKANSVADAVGLRSGDIIIEVNQNLVKTTREFQKSDNRKDRLLLRILRENQFFYISLKR